MTGACGSDGDQRGVRVDHARGGVESGLRNAVHPDLAGVAGNVLDQPVDGVVGVGALVGVLGAALHGLVRADHDVVAFAQIAAANVLIDEDEFLAREQLEGPSAGAVLVDAVGRDAVAGALHHDRVRLSLGDVFGNVDRGEELDAVAHGDAVFELVVVLADEFASDAAGWRRGGRRAARPGVRRTEQAEEERRDYAWWMDSRMGSIIQREAPASVSEWCSGRAARRSRFRHRIPRRRAPPFDRCRASCRWVSSAGTRRNT